MINVSNCSDGSAWPMPFFLIDFINWAWNPGMISESWAARVGKMNFTFLGYLEAREQKKLAPSWPLLAAKWATLFAIVVFPVPAAPINQNTCCIPSWEIQVPMDSKTSVRVPSMHMFADTKSHRAPLPSSIVSRNSNKVRSQSPSKSVSSNRDWETPYIWMGRSQ